MTSASTLVLIVSPMGGRLKFASCSARVTDFMKGWLGTGVAVKLGVTGISGTDSSFGSFDVAKSEREIGVRNIM